MVLPSPWVGSQLPVSPSLCLRVSAQAGLELGRPRLPHSSSRKSRRHMSYTISRTLQQDWAPGPCGGTLLE